MHLQVLGAVLFFLFNILGPGKDHSFENISHSQVLLDPKEGRGLFLQSNFRVMQNPQKRTTFLLSLSEETVFEIKYVLDEGQGR